MNYHYQITALTTRPMNYHYQINVLDAVLESRLVTTRSMITSVPTLTSFFSCIRFSAPAPAERASRRFCTAWSVLHPAYAGAEHWKSHPTRTCDSCYLTGKPRAVSAATRPPQLPQRALYPFFSFRRCFLLLQHRLGRGTPIIRGVQSHQSVRVFARRVPVTRNTS